MEAITCSVTAKTVECPKWFCMNWVHILFGAKVAISEVSHVMLWLVTQRDLQPLKISQEIAKCVYSLWLVTPNYENMPNQKTNATAFDCFNRNARFSVLKAKQTCWSEFCAIPCFSEQIKARGHLFKYHTACKQLDTSRQVTVIWNCTTTCITMILIYLESSWFLLRSWATKSLRTMSHGYSLFRSLSPKLTPQRDQLKTRNRERTGTSQWSCSADWKIL